MMPKQPSPAARSVAWFDRANLGLVTIRRVLAFLAIASPRVARSLAIWSFVEAVAVCCVPYVTMRLIESIFRAGTSREVQTSMVWIALEAALALLLVVAGDLKGLRVQTLVANAQVLLNSEVLGRACS